MSMSGKKHSEETKLKMSLAKKGKPSNFSGKNHCEETKKKMSEKKRGKRFSEETKQRMSVSHKGEKSSTAKLNEQQVIDIRIAYFTGNASQKSLALEFDVSVATINFIVNYKTWTHLPKVI